METHIENIFLSGLGVRLNVHRYSDKRDDILKMCLWILLHDGVFEELFYLYQSFFFNILSIIIQYKYNAHIHLSTAKCRRNLFNCQFVFWDSFQETFTSERTFNNPRYAWY